MSRKEKRALLIRLEGESNVNIMPVTASGVGFDVTNRNYIHYDTDSSQWVETTGSNLSLGNVSVENLYSAGVVTASLGLSGSLTRLSDGSPYIVAGTNVSIASSSNGPITISASTALSASFRELLFFIDEGPACGLNLTGAYKESGPTGPFPTQSVWYTDSSRADKIVENIVVWSGVNPITSTWRSYEEDGSTVQCTVVDTFTYSGVFETTRTRTIS